MIHLDVAKAVGLHGSKESCRFTNFYDQQPSVSVRRVSFKIMSTDGLLSLNIEDAYAVPKLQLPTQTADMNTIARYFPFLRSVSVETDRHSDVCLLIRMDYQAAHAVFELKFDRKDHSGPRAILTPFGWYINCLLPYKLERP
ncbi:Zinc knuckle protein [Trichuris trichiura]|uniref:Zinc knuckle protein n=1 Tax=Trichuris trichiura TaxID=36087 RepID=A0A077ZKI6_TRITR|nr:Zinc knuckle protein [Trichuris trichiura]